MGLVAVDRLTEIAALAAVLLLLSTTACGERSEPTGATVQLYPVTVTGAADRSLTITHPARRIVVLAPSLLEVLDALGARSSVLGMPVRPNGTIVLRRLARLRPDLIVAPSLADEVELSRASAKAHAPVYVAPGDSIREVEQAITELGLLSGEPVRARQLVHRIETRRRLVDQRLDGAPGTRVFFDTGLLTPASDQSLVGDLIRESRGANVAGDESGPIETAELLRLNPRVYLTSSDSGTTLADLRKDPQTRKLSAVRSGRFATVDAALLEPGPRIGDGLLAIARLLHPDAFR
jgi:cobalamin transport system substrate-binding protein